MDFIILWLLGGCMCHACKCAQHEQEHNNLQAQSKLCLASPGLAPSTSNLGSSYKVLHCSSMTMVQHADLATVLQLGSAMQRLPEAICDEVNCQGVTLTSCTRTTAWGAGCCAWHMGSPCNPPMGPFKWPMLLLLLLLSKPLPQEMVQSITSA